MEEIEVHREKKPDLQQVTDKLYHIILYQIGKLQSIIDTTRYEQCRIVEKCHRIKILCRKKNLYFVVIYINLEWDKCPINKYNVYS
jgi:hypothetical protein